MIWCVSQQLVSRIAVLSLGWQSLSNLEVAWWLLYLAILP